MMRDDVFGSLPGVPLFQAATANFNPWTEAAVDTENPSRAVQRLARGRDDVARVRPALCRAMTRRLIR